MIPASSNVKELQYQVEIEFQREFRSQKDVILQIALGRLRAARVLMDSFITHLNTIHFMYKHI